jgi:hypothetical protein
MQIRNLTGTAIHFYDDGLPQTTIAPDLELAALEMQWNNAGGIWWG